MCARCFACKVQQAADIQASAGGIVMFRIVPCMFWSLARVAVCSSWWLGQEVPDICYLLQRLSHPGRLRASARRQQISETIQHRKNLSRTEPLKSKREGSTEGFAST